MAAGASTEPAELLCTEDKDDCRALEVMAGVTATVDTKVAAVDVGVEWRR